MIAGKDKGTTGKVVRAFPDRLQVIVEGVHVKKRHLKPNKATKQGAGIVDISAPIHVSNVQVVDPKTSKPTRIGARIDAETGARSRVAKKSGTILK